MPENNDSVGFTAKHGETDLERERGAEMTEINDKALVPHTGGLDVLQVGKILAACGFFPDIKTISQAAAKILAGQEVGLGPVASLKGVYIINGVPSYSANTIAAAIKRHQRYDYKVRSLTDDECRLEFYEDGQSVGESKFDMKDAEKAGLSGGNWKKYPRNMLFSRALTNGSRWYCPDAFGGSAVYTPDELGAPIDPDTGEIIEGEAREVTEDELAVEAPPRPEPPKKPAVPHAEQASVPRVDESQARPAPTASGTDKASDQQKGYVSRLLSDVGLDWMAAAHEIWGDSDAPGFNSMTVEDAAHAISWLTEHKAVVTA